MNFKVNSNPARVISPEEIERLAAEGLNQAEMAKRLNVAASTLNRRITGSLTIQNAYRSGRRRAAQKVK